MASYEWPPSGGGGGGVTSLNGETGAINIVAGTGITVTPVGQNITISATGSELVFADSIVNNSGTVTLVNDSATPGATKYYGTNSGGTLGYYSIPATGVTSVSVVSANGLAGTVANPTTTPAITLSTTITGTLLAGNGTAISAAALANGDIYVGNASNLPVAVPLSGDATLANTGALTLATVNSNVGSFTSANITVNAKGLITAASNGSGGGSGTVTSVALTTPGVLYSVSGSPVTTSGTLALNLINQTANTVLAGPSSGGSGAPAFRALTNADLPPSTNNAIAYSQAFFGPGSSWSTTSSLTPVDPTNSGGNALTVRQHSGLTLTAAASNLPGITFTPANASASYLITASMGVANNAASGGVIAQLTDGTTVIAVSCGPQTSAGYTTPLTMNGVYTPGTTSPVTVKVQIAIDTGATATIQSVGATASTSIEWTVTQIVGGAVPVQFFQASSVINTNCTNVTSTSFVTISNSPALTITPTITGTYKIYAPLPLDSSSGANGTARIFNTTGGATLLAESQGLSNGQSTEVIASAYTQSIYTLTAGTPYVFDIQLKSQSGAAVSIDGSVAQYYMFAEGVSLMGASGGGITEAQVWARVAYGM